MTNKKGFTLIELTIVTQLLILLSAMIVPSLMRQFQVDMLKKTALDVHEIQGAARNYYVDNDDWPLSFDDLKNGGVYLHANFDDENPFGYDYTFTSTTDAFSVSAQVLTDLVNLGKNLLPNTTSSDDIVTSTISVPGASASSGLWADVVLLSKVSCPSGYTRVNTLDDKFLVGGNSYSTSVGGSNMITISENTDNHALTINEMPSHNHGVQINDTRIPGPNRKPETAGISSTYAWPSDYTGGGRGHSHGLTSVSADNRPEYATLVVCVKD